MEDGEELRAARYGDTWEGGMTMRGVTMTRCGEKEGRRKEAGEGRIWWLEAEEERI